MKPPWEILMFGLAVLRFSAGASAAAPANDRNAAFTRQNGQHATPLPLEGDVPRDRTTLPPEGGVPSPMEGPLQPAAARIQFAATTNDFGRVIAGSRLRHAFIFTNTGQAPLLITEVQARCGCTTAGDWTRAVPPGQTGVIPLQYQTPRLDIPTAKEATVSCNDPQQPTVRLELRATLWRPIAVEPEMAVFTATNYEHAISDRELRDAGVRVVRIVNQEPQPLVLSAPVGDSRLFAAELRTNVPGREYELRIRAVPPLAGAPRLSGYFTLQTSSTNLPELRVMAYLQVLRQPVVPIVPAGPPARSEAADWLATPVPEPAMALRP